jgi:hypothetical protein
MPDQDEKKKVVLSGGGKPVDPSEATRMDAGNGGVPDPMKQRDTDTGSMKRMDAPGSKQNRRTIKLKPISQSGEEEAGAEDITMEETMSMERDKVMDHQAPRSATIIRKDSPASAQTAQMKAAGGPIKLTPVAATDKDEDDTVSIERPDRPPRKPMVQTADNKEEGEKVGDGTVKVERVGQKPAAEGAAPQQRATLKLTPMKPGTDEDDDTVTIDRPEKPAGAVVEVGEADDANVQQKTHRTLPGAKQTIKLRPSTAGGAAEKASPTQADAPGAKGTIKLKPAESASGDDAKGRNTIKLMPKSAGGGGAVAAAKPSDQTVDAEEIAEDVSPSSPTVKGPIPEAGAPKSPTIKLKPKSSAATADGTAEPTPSSPTVRYDAPSGEPGKKQLTIQKPSAAAEPPSVADAPDYLKDLDAPLAKKKTAQKDEPAWLYAVAACLVVGALGYYIVLLVQQIKLLERLG